MIAKIKNMLTKPKAKAFRFVGLGFFTLCFIFAGTVAFVNSQPSSALTYEGGANVGFIVNDTINISLSGNLTIPDLMTGTSDDSDAMSIQVSVNTDYGYSLSAQMANTSADLTASGTSVKFTGLASDASVPSLSADTWGYKTSTNSGSTWSNYSGLPVSTGNAKTLVDKDSKPSGGTETTQVKIGAYASSEIETNTYTNTIVFTAVAKTPPVKYMQDVQTWASTELPNVGDSIQAVDQRDNKQYWVTKLADGNIWMTQNLDLVLSTSTTLTPSDSNVSANWTPNNNTQTYQYKEADGTTTHSDADTWDEDYNTKAHSYRPASDPAAGTSGDYGNDGDTYFSPAYITNGTTMSSYKTEAECIAGGNTQSDCQHWSVGTLYSWYAATAGTGNASVSTETDVTDSICPKGWHLPSSTSSGEFQALVTAAGLTSSNITASPYYFLRAGYYSGRYGAVYRTGGDGCYWSRMSYSNTYDAYNLLFNSSSVYPSYNNGRYNGFSIRCVAGS